jgi:hypothetical protein
MRTTLDIDEDVLQAAKALAVAQKRTAGKVLSDLARRALRPAGTQEVRNGVPLLPARPGARVVTPDVIERLLDEET